MRIKVGTTIELTLNGNNGTVTLEGTRLSTDMKNNITLNANTSTKMSSGNINIEAGGMMKLSSNGLINIDGNPIKLG